jgi:hypothetical protein
MFLPNIIKKNPKKQEKRRLTSETRAIYTVKYKLQITND